jgi:hypothetical protein
MFRVRCEINLLAGGTRRGAPPARSGRGRDTCFSRRDKGSWPRGLVGLSRDRTRSKLISQCALSLKRFVSFAAVTLLGTGIIFPATAGAQYNITNLNNRKLKATHLKVANSGPSVPGVVCSGAGCVGEMEPFPASSVACPGTSGTCTFEFEVCARIAPKANGFTDNYFHRIRIDGAAPSPGPTDLSFAIPPGAPPVQENFCVTSAASGIAFGNHTVTLKLGVVDLGGNGGHAELPNVVFKIKVYKP